MLLISRTKSLPKYKSAGDKHPLFRTEVGTWSGRDVEVEDFQQGERTWSIYWRDELWHKIRSDFAVLLEDECHSAIRVPGGRRARAEERGAYGAAWNVPFLESCHDTIISLQRETFYCCLFVFIISGTFNWRSCHNYSFSRTSSTCLLVKTCTQTAAPQCRENGLTLSL